MPKKGEKTDTPKCPICGAFLTPIPIESTNWGQKNDYKCLKCEREGR